MVVRWERLLRRWSTQGRLKDWVFKRSIPSDGDSKPQQTMYRFVLTLYGKRTPMSPPSSVGYSPITVLHFRSWERSYNP